MSYTVLARRYRSSTFEDIVGQEPIARTLRNAIESDRTAHAYLFSGTRGVGKTSMARIFARELNSSEDLTQKGEISKAILRGEDLDVIGEVIWSSRKEMATPGRNYPPGMGVKFLNLSTEGIKRIISVLTQT